LGKRSERIPSDVHVETVLVFGESMNLLAIPLWIMTAMLGSFVKRCADYDYDAKLLKTFGVKY
jgi:hypothetical protein